MKRFTLVAASALAALVMLAPVASADNITVTRDRLRGWELSSSANGSAELVNNPEQCDPGPRGNGSLQLIVNETGGDANDFARARRASSFARVNLVDLEEMEYATCAVSNDGNQWPYIIMRIDFDDDETTDELLFFEPEYQNGHTTECPEQAEHVLNDWQQWDARDGCWWALNGTAGAGPGANVKPLEDIIDEEPFSEIVNIDLVQGFGGDGSYEAYVDDFLLVEDDGLNKRFNFERR